MAQIKYFKNFILSGDLDYRCLVCKENFTGSEQVDKHLRWEKHRKALKTQNCLPQFRNDFIYKLDPFYYCSLCNRTMQSIAEVKQHVDSDIHKNYKINPAISSNKVEVTMIDNDIFIKNNPIGHFQWHGIVDRQCVFCNVPVTVLSNHMYNEEHIVRLIQAKVNYVDDKYYRKIDKLTFQCFSCEKVIPMQKFDEHFSNHTNNPTAVPPVEDCNIKVNKEKQRIEDGNELKDCTMPESSENPIVVGGLWMAKLRKREWNIDLLAGLKDDYFEIHMKDEKLTCKICKKDIKIILNDISSHIFTHSQYRLGTCAVYNAINKYITDRYIEMNFDHGAERSKVAHYGKANFIKLNEGGRKGYCTLCDKFLSPHIDVFKAHANGSFHNGHLELKGIGKPRKHERGSYKPFSIMEVISSLRYSADDKAFLINGFLLLEEDSFFLMKRIEHGKYYKKTKCFACDEILLPDAEKEHCVSWKHKSNMLAAKSITEQHWFIREIRPKLYHCAICNESLPYWESYKRHITQLSHLMSNRQNMLELMQKLGFTKNIVLKTTFDNIYMQLLNAIFNTKYVIKL